MRPKTVIIDLDGTLANSKHRAHFLTGENGYRNVEAWRIETDKDVPNEWCVDLILGYRAQGYQIIYLTGREETCRETTNDWLLRHVPGSQHERLLMRPKDDNRPDHEIKLEVYLRDILPFYQVVMAVDDRPSIAKLWRSLGITCLHCETWEEDQAKMAKIHETFEQDMEKRK